MPLAKKSLGQHWLTDAAALQAICEAGEITPTDTVLEIGPGPGTLTKYLLATGAQIIAIEKDPSLAQKLYERTVLSYSGQSDTLEDQAKNYMKGQSFHIDGRLRVVEGDILTFDLTSLPASYKVVANIPYYLTSNLIRTLSESSNRAERVILLVQKEVAQRAAAKPGAMSLLSVSAQFYWNVSLGLEVPARLFTPPPKVDSQVLILTRRPETLFPDLDIKQFFRIVKAGYSARRKTLLNSLSAGLRLPKDQVASIITLAGSLPSQRPQELSITEWYDIYNVFQKNT